MKRLFLLLLPALLAAPLAPSLAAPLAPSLAAPLAPSLAAPPAAQANDYPTSGRVEYVLECMQKHDGKYEYLYKCSCVIDHIARQMSYDDYVTMSTALRNQTMAGERGAMFRDPVPVKEMASKYKALQASADKACYVQAR